MTNEHKVLAAFIEGNNHICRHVATSKNDKDIHGRSAEIGPSRWTNYQIKRLENFCKERDIKRVFFGDTPQCEFTARALSENQNLSIHKVSLKPFDLGGYSGLSHLELIGEHKELAKALERFRYRLTCYSNSGLEKVQHPEELSIQILKWLEGIQCSPPRDALLVLSNLLLVKIINGLHGIYPRDERYFNIGVANGSVVNLEEWSYDQTQWPDTRNCRIPTEVGDLVVTEFIPKSGLMKNGRVLIYPGVFGSSRFGPYNLFNRLARALADLGFAAIVVDPIGSGESLPIFRDVGTETRSISAVLERYRNTEGCVVVAHSLSANLVARLNDARVRSKILLAPILDVEGRRSHWVNGSRIMNRHGLQFDTDFWDPKLVALAGKDYSSFAFFGDRDAYVDHRMADTFFCSTRTILISGAGHNFSEGSAPNTLIGEVCNCVQFSFFN